MPQQHPRSRTNPTKLPARISTLELLAVHHALEGWIHRQHGITRELVVKEIAQLRKEITVLRKELRRERRKRDAAK